MRVLITGVSGFVGGHLLPAVAGAEPSAELFGLALPGEETAASVPTVVLRGDVRDPEAVRAAVQASRPDVVFHLAGQASVADTLDAPAELLRVNLLGTLHLLEAVRTTAPRCVVVLAGSADCYGAVAANELPITEEHPFRPLSPYAVSKAAVDLMGYQYFRGHGLATIRLRLFNHCGPGQSERFVVASLARQIALIEAGLAPPELQVGNLGVRRDFVDVRDAVRAYWLTATRGTAGAAYNVATGEAHAIGEIAERLLELSGVKARLVVDSRRLRTAEIPELRGDASRLRDATGWEPTVPLAETLQDTLDDWRERVARGAGHPGTP